MKPSEVLENNRQAIREATKRFNAANPRVFGSVARGEDRADSDLIFWWIRCPARRCLISAG
jgi:predicted nucleotidyltransferase